MLPGHALLRVEFRFPEALGKPCWSSNQLRNPIILVLDPSTGVPICGLHSMLSWEDPLACDNLLLVCVPAKAAVLTKQLLLLPIGLIWINLYNLGWRGAVLLAPGRFQRESLYM